MALDWFILKKSSHGASIVFHLLCLHSLTPQFISDIVPQGWSVSVEVLFYCMVPGIIKNLNHDLGRYIRILFICTGAVWALDVLAYKVCGIIGLAISEDFWYLWLPNQIPAFLVGIILYLVMKENQKVDKKTGKYIVGIIILLFLSISAVLRVSVLFAILIYVLSRYNLVLVNNRVFRWIGKVSYGVYLSHTAIITILQRIWPIETAGRIGCTLYLVGIPAISVAVGTILYFLLEQPFILLERKIERVLAK